MVHEKHHHHHQSTTSSRPSLLLSPKNYEEIESAIYQYFVWRKVQNQQETIGNDDVHRRYHTIVLCLGQELLLPSVLQQKHQPTEVPEICIRWMLHTTLEPQQHNVDSNDDELISQHKQQNMEEDDNKVFMSPQKEARKIKIVNNSNKSPKAKTTNETKDDNRKITATSITDHKTTKKTASRDDDNVAIMQLVKQSTPTKYRGDHGSTAASGKKRKRTEEREDHDVKKKVRSNNNQYIRTTRSVPTILENNEHDARKQLVKLKAKSPMKTGQNQSFESSNSQVRGESDEGGDHSMIDIVEEEEELNIYQELSKQMNEAATKLDHDDDCLSDNIEGDEKLSSSSRNVAVRNDVNDDDEEQQLLELLEYQALKEKENYMLAKEKLMKYETITKRKEMQLRKVLQEESDEVKRKTYRWEERYEQVLEFYSKHGHSRIPQNHFLYKWVTNQRHFYRLKNSKLTPARIAKLDALGFNWNPGSKLTFLQFFDHCKEYIAKYGNCNIPNQLNQLNEDGTEATEDDKVIRMWARMARATYHNKRFSKKRYQSQIDMLDSIGFVWGVPRQSVNDNDPNGGGDVTVPTTEENDRSGGGFHERYLDRIEQLRKVIEVYGIIDKKCVLSVYPNNPQLHSWVKCQRRDYRLWRNGKTSPFNQERYQLLRSIGFDFEPRKHYAAPNPESARNIKRRSREQAPALIQQADEAEKEKGVEQVEDVDTNS